MDTQLYSRFVHRLLERGIYMTPSNGLHWIISTAHTDKDVATLIEAADLACAISDERRRPRQIAVVFLGGGRITTALLAGLRLAGIRQPVIVHDRNPYKLRQLKRQYDVQVEPDLRRAVERAHLLIVAVRPDGVRDLLQQVGQLRMRHARPITASAWLREFRSSICAHGWGARSAGPAPCPARLRAPGMVLRR